MNIPFWVMVGLNILVLGVELGRSGQEEKKKRIWYWDTATSFVSVALIYLIATGGPIL
jgi:hypothetical protein